MKEPPFGRAMRPWGEGSWEVEETSPTATQVEQERDVGPKWVRNMASLHRTEDKSISELDFRTAATWSGSGGRVELMSVVEKDFGRPRNLNRAPKFLMRSFSSSPHRSWDLRDSPGLGTVSRCRPSGMGEGIRIKGPRLERERREISVEMDS